MTLSETGRTHFFVGVSGYMELVTGEIDPLTERLCQLFRDLRDGAPLYRSANWLRTSFPMRTTPACSTLTAPRFPTGPDWETRRRLSR